MNASIPSNRFLTPSEKTRFREAKAIARQSARVIGEEIGLDWIRINHAIRLEPKTLRLAPEEIEKLMRWCEGVEAKASAPTPKSVVLSELAASLCFGPEDGHLRADQALVAFVRALGHDDVADAFESVSKWYA